MEPMLLSSNNLRTHTTKYRKYPATIWSLEKN
jgi:hypothetical protein